MIKTINKSNKGSNLRECLGILKKDEEIKKIEKDLKTYWKNWTKKYI